MRLGMAMTLAQLHQSQLILLHVVDTRAIDTMARYGKESKEALLVKAEESGWKVLYSLEEEAVSSHVRVALTLEEGTPQRVILDVAEKIPRRVDYPGKTSQNGFSERCCHSSRH